MLKLVLLFFLRKTGFFNESIRKCNITCMVQIILLLDIKYHFRSGGANRGLRAKLRWSLFLQSKHYWHTAIPVYLGVVYDYFPAIME